MTTTPVGGGRRAYRSPRRQQQAAETRAVVLAATETALGVDPVGAGTVLDRVARQVITDAGYVSSGLTSSFAPAKPVVDFLSGNY